MQIDTADSKGLFLQGPVLVVSRDQEFVHRVRSSGMRETDSEDQIVVAEDPLVAVVRLLERPIRVVIYDLDRESQPKHQTALRAIRLSSRSASIILCASDHSTMLPEPLDEIGIYYRLLKSAPEAELRTAMASAQRFPHR
jgi:hypothetical protein